MCKRCYICNKILTKEAPTDKDRYSQSHEEHIIQNAILGHYTSHDILCKNCGNSYSKEDESFAKIFASFIELMRKGGRLRKKDRKDTPITIPGSLFASKDSEGLPFVDVVYRDGRVEPKTPSYNINEERKTIEIYHSSKGYEKYQSGILEKLNGDGFDVSEYTIVPRKELSKDGFLGLFFSKDKPNFNKDLLAGLAKIAVEFALDKGVSRENLKDALVIDTESGRSYIDYDKVRVIPFCSFDLINSIFENERQRYESTYPSHSLHLFTIGYEDVKVLYCYIDLFSTFQFYVILDTDYKGKDVSATYAQKLLVNYSYSDDDIDTMDNSDIDLVIRENHLDRKAIVDSGSRYREVIKDQLRKKGPEFDLMEMKSKAFEVVLRDVTMYLCSIRNKSSFELPLHESSIDIIKQYIDNYKLSFVDMQQIAVFVGKHYRDLFLRKELDGTMEIASYPSDCADWYNKHKDVVRMYTLSVFSKLCGYCHEVAGVN